MTSTSRFILAILIIGGALLIARLTERPMENQTFSDAPVLREMPNFKVVDLKGQDWVAMEHIQHDAPILIHFWGTWCAPCEEEFPGLIQFIKEIKNRSQLRVVLVAVQDKEVEVRKFLDEKKLDIPLDVDIVIDASGDAQKLFNTVKVPETYLFNSKFQTLRKFIGPQRWEGPEFIDFFKSL